MIVDIDADLQNADWTKQTADFPQFPGGFPQAAQMSGIPLELAMKLPASYLPGQRLTAGALDDAFQQLRPSRVVFEFDNPSTFGQREDLDRETAYQIKFFYDHGFWSPDRLSGDEHVDLLSAQRIAVAVVTDPLNPSSEEARDRLIAEGLLF